MSTLTRSQAPGAQMSTLTRSQAPGAQMSSLTRSQGPGAQMNSLTRSHEPGAPGTLTRSQSRDSDGVQRVMVLFFLVTMLKIGIFLSLP